MATVLAKNPPVTGLNLTANASAASAGGDVIDTGDTVGIIVFTAGTGTTVTITTPGTVSGLAIADNAVTIGTNVAWFIPLPTSLYGDSNGQAAISWSATASVTFIVVRR